MWSGTFIDVSEVLNTLMLETTSSSGMSANLYQTVTGATLQAAFVFLEMFCKDWSLVELT
jgi:hypothetical protein